MVLIETINLCNRKCWFCKFGQERQREPKAKMNEAMIERLIDDLKSISYTNRISWVGINEPLLDKRICDFIGKVKKELPLVFQSTITNGDLLDTESYIALKEAGLNSLAISVYDVKSLEKASKLKERFPEIIVWNKMSYNDQEWVLTKECSDFTNRAGEVKQIDCGSMVNVPCQKPFTGISVLPNGDVPLCSDDMYGDVIMGNVLQTRIDRIWFGAKFDQYRRKLRKGRSGLKLCEVCTNKGGPHIVRFP